METIVINKATLSISLAKKNEMPMGKFVNGQMKQTDKNRFEFQETVRENRKPRTQNPKLFNGDFVSLTRNANGFPKLSFKAIDEDTDMDHLAFNVYQEVEEALKTL